MDEDSEVEIAAENDVPQGELEEESQAGTRLAMYKMDWDITNAADILAIFQSLCRSGEHIVTKVEIYPSLLGLEQMKKDALYGPPTKVFRKDYKPRKLQPKDDEESDSEEERNAFLEEQVEDGRAYD